MGDIRPIETVYNGYRFRSRLEARWAVFFDALGVSYNYEPQGFVLHDGKKYLPDFFLPDFNLFVEIKASRQADDQKAKTFSEDNNVGGVLVCYGDPASRDLRFLTANESDWGGGGCYDTDWGDYYRTTFQVSTIGEVFIFVNDDKPERCFYEVKHVYSAWSYPVSDDFCDKLVEKAEALARQARFEHGDQPKIRSLIKAEEDYFGVPF